MRYEDWDILIFPSDRTIAPGSTQTVKVPLKEFKVACHVVADYEIPHGHGSPGLPVMTCFVPSLPTGTPFHVSIHSWRTPEISQYTKNFSKHTELVQFEARIYIDGRLVSSTSFARNGDWPCLITTTFEFTKSGELEPFRFPPFRRELLYHDHWHPSDDIGRIKIVISEGFPRDSLTNPIERVKNVVAFSFQHAPLGKISSYLDQSRRKIWAHEKRSIKISWKPIGLPGQIPLCGKEFPVRKTGQSPRIDLETVPSPMDILPAAIGGTPIPVSCSDASIKWYAGLNKSAYNMRTARRSSTDTSMPDFGTVPDYSSSASGYNTVMLEPSNVPTAVMTEEAFAPAHVKAPTNTPIVGPMDCSYPPGFSFNLPNSAIPGDLAASLTHSLLNQPYPLPVQPHMVPLPASEVKSRKETRKFSNFAAPCSPAIHSPCVEILDKRNFSSSAFTVAEVAAAVASDISTPSQQSFHMLPPHAVPRGPPEANNDKPFYSSSTGSRACSSGDLLASFSNLTEVNAAPVMTATASGANNTIVPLGEAAPDRCNKRLRNFTPARSKAIDEEDEPRRVSPRLRATTFAAQDRCESI
ncbi:uncharacterized protein PpBr36_10484 [Pyricularia pennisetigena]|uniref:uncharacterized protein n=1 Tax=Pyricularia pennisetigena TaxID=1578925 RepID=UPI0011500C51|nr:uncharacterized protein PpBr36_10484 [Pyricularia pennisetigena]TLS21117.1 hypothetical protein PpBr36_10484 [Pyricularia pennisetigena]